MLPLITSKLLKRKTNVSVLQSAEYIDDDVATEEKRVVEKSKDELQVRVSMFNKVYIQRFNSTVAVKQASFGLQYGECFALLGVNGAGKTTTFKCLTNEVKPTGG
jgi:ATP-binding cassette subfamily A (ABC1) protein 3